MNTLYFDTSCLPPYFTTEADSDRVTAFFEKGAGTDRWAISHWTITEFHSAIALKVRSGQLPADRQLPVLSRFEEIVQTYFECWNIKQQDYLDAARFTNEWRYRLRSGDALHLAIARSHHARMISLDDDLLRAAKHFKVQARSI